MTLVVLLCASDNPANGVDATPDGLQAIARKGMVAALLGNRSDLEQLAAKAKGIEQQEGTAPKSGRISDKLLELRAWSAPSPAEKTALLKALVKEDPDPPVLRQVQHARRQEPASQIRRLRRENHYNAFTGLFNYMFHLGSNLLTLNTQSLSQLGVDFCFLWEPFVELSPQDRNAIVVYDQNRQEIDPADCGRLSPMIEHLRNHLKRRNTEEEILCGDWYMRRGLWEQARMAYVRARLIEPSNTRARKGEVAALGQISSLYRARIRSVEVPAEEVLRPKEAEAATDLMRTVCAGTPGEARRAARGFREKFPESRLASDAAYTETALPGAEERAGSAEAYLSSSSGNSTRGAARLRAYRDSAAANPDADLRQAAAEHRANMWTYVLNGRDETSDFPTIAGGTVQQVHQILNSYGLLLPLDWARRGAAIAFTTPVDDGEWRGAAVNYIDRQTSGAKTREVSARLANSFEHKQQYDQARMYHTLAFGDDPAYTARLDEKSAQQLRRLAESQTDMAQKRALLETTARRFPRTKAGAKAKTQVARIDREGYDLAQVKKDELASWPDVWLNKGLRLDPRWFDGNLVNGEIASDGVHFRAPEGKTIEFTLRYPSHKQKRRLAPAADQLAEIRAALRVWQGESTSRQRAEAMFNRPPILMEVQGSAGLSGVDVFPQLMPLSFDQETLPLYRSPMQAQD